MIEGNHHLRKRPQPQAPRALSISTVHSKNFAHYEWLLLFGDGQFLPTVPSPMEVLVPDYKTLKGGTRGHFSVILSGR